jgi:hypothetical protein
MSGVKNNVREATAKKQTGITSPNVLIQQTLNLKGQVFRSNSAVV